MFAEALGTELAKFVWPAVVVLFLWLLFGTETGRAVLGGLRQVKIGQLHLELDGANASQVKARLEEVFENNRAEVRRAFREESRVRRIAELRDAVARGVLQEITGGSAFRCTVYVPDVLFEDALYCLLDYWPEGVAAGNAFSVRYGIIGRAWRLRESKAEKVVAGNQAKLMTEWGMTYQEAARHTNDRSFLAVMLAGEHSPEDAVGILFADGPPHTFRQDQCNHIEGAYQTRRLAEAVGEVVREMRRRGPELKVLER